MYETFVKRQVVFTKFLSYYYIRVIELFNVLCL